MAYQCQKWLGCILKQIKWLSICWIMEIRQKKRIRSWSHSHYCIRGKFRGRQKRRIWHFDWRWSALLNHMEKWQKTWSWQANLKKWWINRGLLPQRYRINCKNQSNEFGFQSQRTYQALWSTFSCIENAFKLINYYFFAKVMHENQDCCSSLSSEWQSLESGFSSRSSLLLRL